MVATERLLHAWRRRRAVARLRRRALPRSVLVVCHGNICRSPFAAAVLRRALPTALASAVRVSSAGFVGPGREAPGEARAAARRRGIDLSAHRSGVLTPELVRGADLIVVMEPAQARAIQAHFGRDRRDVLVLGDLDPLPAQRRAVRDPVQQPPEVYEASYARIERCVGVMADALVRVERAS